MVKKFLLEALIIITLLSGIFSILALVGWVLGAPDGLFLLSITGPVFVVFAIALSFVKDGWQRLLGEIFIIWPF